MILLKNGKVFTEDGFEESDVLLDGNIIRDIGHIHGSYENVLDLDGCFIIPGLVDMSSSIGLIEAGVKTEGNDLDERSKECISDMHSVDGINFEDRYFNDALTNGVTSAVITSGNLSVIGAVSSLVKTNAVDFSGIIKQDADISVTLGEKPKKPFGSKFTPLSRMGIVDIIRRNLMNTKIYMAKKEQGKIDYINFDPCLESLAKVLKKEIPLKIYAEKKQDIEIAIALKEEFNIRIIINGGADSYKTVNILKNSEIPVILGSCLKEQSFIELKDRRNDTAMVLKDNNIPFAISTHHPNTAIDLLHMSMCLTCKYGLSEAASIQSVTLEPMKILGLDDSRGSIEKGKVADIAIFDGNPTYSLSKVIYTIIDGKIVYKNNSLKRDDE
ncbi:amidohydrolase family protein [Wukongibacter sp. M2B1]|uniref:amidohydrolase family protein n=1 Tax=Wukongibacter sp. M2B1 TaxID=3088895 RepID=UPI003D78DBD4